MTREEIVKHLEYLKIAAEIDAKPENINAEIIGAAIQELKKGSQVVATITFDRDEMQEMVEEAKKEIQMEIKALKQEPPKTTWDAIINGTPLPEGHGRWIDGKCNRCGTHAPFWPMASTYYCSNYCPNCGAKMAESEE